MCSRCALYAGKRVRDIMTFTPNMTFFFAQNKSENKASILTNIFHYYLFPKFFKNSLDNEPRSRVLIRQYRPIAICRNADSERRAMTIRGACNSLPLSLVGWIWGANLSNTRKATLNFLEFLQPTPLSWLIVKLSANCPPPTSGLHAPRRSRHTFSPSGCDVIFLSHFPTITLAAH